MSIRPVIAIALGLTMGSAHAADITASRQTAASAKARAGEAEFRALYKELVEINTTLSVGSCTAAANAMKARLSAAGFSDEQLHLVVPPDRPNDGNLVAWLPGSDAKLKSEAVIFTAHWDHLGLGKAALGDNIYNGAADNATGCGILLELARAWTTIKNPPHSVIFAAVTAEEQGLLGSEYLGQRPPIPAGQIALDLNYDAVQPFGDPLAVTLTGADRTTFFSSVQSTAKQFDLQIIPEAHPEAGEYYRSDHFSLARVGIPSFSIDEGTLYAGHDAAWGLAKGDDYTEHRYHTPMDNYTSEMDFTGNAKLARFGMDLGWQALSAHSSITWRPKDEFLPAREKSLSAK